MDPQGSPVSSPGGSGEGRGTWVCVHVFIRTRVFVCGVGLCLFGREVAVVSGTLSLTFSGSYRSEPAGLSSSDHSQRPPTKHPERFRLLPQAPLQP